MLCPRCRKPAIRSYGEWWCPQHETFEAPQPPKLTPMDAWVFDEGMQVPLPGLGAR